MLKGIKQWRPSLSKRSCATAPSAATTLDVTTVATICHGNLHARLPAPRSQVKLQRLDKCPNRQDP